MKTLLAVPFVVVSLIFAIASAQDSISEPSVQSTATTQAYEPTLPTRFQLIWKETLEGHTNEWIFIYRDTFTGHEFVMYNDSFFPLGISKKGEPTFKKVHPDAILNSPSILNAPSILDK